jgi:hypothetical protein
MPLSKKLKSVCLFVLTSRGKMADPVHQMQIGGPFPGREHAICPRRDALVKRVGGQIAPTRRAITQLCGVYNYINIFIHRMCLANYGASEAVYPCNVVEKIHEYFRSKMCQYL